MATRLAHCSSFNSALAGEDLTGSRVAAPRLAARRWLVRYLSEGTPSLRDVAKVTASLASLERRG